MTGVRRAVITVQRLDTPLRFLLVPMLHIGTPDYYRDVARSLSRCQVIVAEGVGGDSALTRALTLAYRTPARSKSLGLVAQDIDLRALGNAGAQVVTPDSTDDQIRRGWRTVPWVHRVAVLTLIPVFALALKLFGSRRVLGRFLGRDDLPTPQDHGLRQAFPALTEMILDERDRLLVNALVSILAARRDQPIVVGVAYGAAHMTAVVRELAGHGYRPRRAEWLTGVDVDEAAPAG